MKALKIAYGLTVAGLATAVYGSIVIVLAAFGATLKSTYPFARKWARVLLGANGVTVKLENEHLVKWDQPMVLISNHRSHYDVPSMIYSLPVPLSFITKQELRRIPVFGKGVASLGMVFVDRKNREAALRSLEDAARQVREGRVVTFFAEGTRSDDGQTMLPFKKGGFRMAQESGVPIQPVVVLGTERVLPKHSLLVSAGEVVIRFAEAIPTRPDDDLDELMARTRKAMIAVMDTD
jgi:1-acyl-sn-glycerol-3-phosphate acyltransferase